MSSKIVGFLTYSDGNTIILNHDDGRAGIRERVYAALCAARAPEIQQQSSEFFVRYQPRKDSFSLVSDDERSSRTWIHSKVGLEETATRDALEKLGCTYKEVPC